jgi:hypothetical protein
VVPRLCLTAEIRTCFLGVPHIVKVPKHNLDLYPEVYTLMPPVNDSDNEDDDPKKKLAVRNKSQKPVQYYESVLKPI